MLLMLLTGSAAVPVHVMLVVQPARWGMSSPGCQLPDPNLTVFLLNHARRFWWHEQGKQQQQQEPEMFDTMRRHWGF